MGSSQTPDITKVKSKVDEIKKMVVELYDRPIISEPVVAIVVPNVHVDNIWAIQVLVEEPREERRESNREVLKKK